MEMQLLSSLRAIIEQQKGKARAFVSLHEPGSALPSRALLPGRVPQTETFPIALSIWH